MKPPEVTLGLDGGDGGAVDGGAGGRHYQELGAALPLGAPCPGP